MINEFKMFIAKGNVMDMAVGIIVGAAFTAIVSSLVGDLINPIIGLVIGGIDFSLPDHRFRGFHPGENGQPGERRGNSKGRGKAGRTEGADPTGCLAGNPRRAGKEVSRQNRTAHQV